MRTLALAMLIQAMASGAAFSAILRTFDDGLPPRVIEIMHKQIERYLGTNDFKGVPLLDRTIDWNFFTNWPDQFSFKGHTYRLELTDALSKSHNRLLSAGTVLWTGSTLR